MKNLCLLLCAAVSFICTHQLDADKDTAAQQPYPMVTFSMYSTIVGDTIVVDVTLPEHYVTGSTFRFPVFYLTVGGNEDPYRFLNPFKQLVDVLEGRHYTGFFMKSFIDPGKDHYTVWEPTLYESIRMFLKK
jgi:hypothetical protein